MSSEVFITFIHIYLKLIVFGLYWLFSIKYFIVLEEVDHTGLVAECKSRKGNTYI